MSRSLRFTAKDVGACEQNGAFVVGFARARSDESSEEALILQRAADDSEDSGIYVEIPIQRYVCYDGVKEAVLGRNSLSVTFYPDAVAELGDIGAMQISFTSSDSEFANLAETLRRIFRGHESFAIDVANQSTDPTLASGTPPAGQESRHP
jgi:hypothetical protein